MSFFACAVQLRQSEAVLLRGEKSMNVLDKFNMIPYFDKKIF